MPMFQVEHGRAFAAPQHAGAPETSGSHEHGVVGEGLDALLAEHLLPLRTRDGDDDEPYLLAVDASGQPVVVEVVGLLDEGALLQALRHTGRAAGLSTMEIARAYRAGPERFTADLEAFRETVPATSLLSTTVNGGARLLLVCAQVAPGMQDVVEFLLQPGCQVDVLQVGLIQGADGHRILDVSPLTRHAPARRGLEPTVVHRLRSVRPGPVAGPTSTGPGPLVGPGPMAGPTQPAEAAPHEPVPPHQRGAVLTPPRWPSEVSAEPTRRLPTLVPPPFATRVGAPRPAAPEASGRTEAPVTADRPVAADSRVTPASPSASESREPAEDLPYAFTGAVPPVRVPDARMQRLASAAQAPAVLVWHRERRNEWFEALLHPDGWIELPDGSRHTDPSVAAAVVSGATVPVDGWRVWRLDSTRGRTLAELAPA
ncbi:MAG TPA: hypothetical protein VGK35_06955 [Actinotalea sp.]